MRSPEYSDLRRRTRYGKDFLPGEAGNGGPDEGIRSAVVGWIGQTSSLSQLDLRLLEPRGRGALLRYRAWAIPADRRRESGPDLCSTEPSECRNSRGPVRAAGTRRRRGSGVQFRDGGDLHGVAWLSRTW